jgi:uncharacterized protein YbbK (DUF523 family)
LYNGKIAVAVSACLLGQPVRYDGQHKYNKIIAEILGGIFQLIPICPEVSCGMGVPRPKIQLLEKEQRVILTGKKNQQFDFNKEMIQAAINFLARYTAICGIILKDKSPSCAIGNTQIFNPEGATVGYGNGLFAQVIIDLAPEIPVIQAESLNNKMNRDIFVEQVLKYTRPDVNQ